MAAPLVLLAQLLELLALFITVDEVATIAEDLYEGWSDFDKGLEGAKKQIKEDIERLKKEIDLKIDHPAEKALLIGMASKDPQGAVTKKPAGRGANNVIMAAAIQEKIPFRKVISSVCAKAELSPILKLRTKKGLDPKDALKLKSKLVEKITGMALEEALDLQQSGGLDGFILIKLKQLVVNHCFEFMDCVLDWKSPLKAEVCYGPAPVYAEPKMKSGTQLLRTGTTALNPFYPAPHRRKGSQSADLVIPETRHAPPGKSNIFAIVEIKFPNDEPKEEQFTSYRKLLDHAAEVKNAKAASTHMGLPVSGGGHLSLLRWPEDRAADPEPDDTKPKEIKKSKKTTAK
jgi:hypothetical protein